MFPAVKAYQVRCAELARTEECVYTVTGQRRFLPPLKDDANEFGYWPSLEFRKRVLVNTPILGSSANLLIRAVTKFMPKLPAGVQIVNLVHDEVDAVVTAATAEPAKQIITAAFEESFAELFGHQLKVKLETKIRKTWGVPPG